MSAPDDKAATALAKVRSKIAQRKSRSIKSRISEGIELYRAETGLPVPEGLKPSELLARINPCLRRAGYTDRELPKPRQVHQARTGR